MADGEGYEEPEVPNWLDVNCCWAEGVLSMSSKVSNERCRQ